MHVYVCLFNARVCNATCYKSYNRANQTSYRVSNSGTGGISKPFAKNYALKKTRGHK